MNENKRKEDILNKAAWIITVTYLVFIIFFCALSAQFHHIKNFTFEGLNEVGDFFAGIFAPLAFFWLIFGFYQQKQELNNSTSALNLQVEELAKATKQHEELVKASREALEYEKEKGELFQRELVAKQQPKFEIVFGPTTSRGTTPRTYSYRCSYENMGAFARDLKVEFLHRTQSIHKRSFPMFRSGQIEEFRPQEKFNAFYDKIYAHFDFTDINGNNQTHVFEIALDLEEISDSDSVPKHKINKIG